MALKSIKHTHTVDFFDNLTMRNRTEPCRVVRMDDNFAVVEVDNPIRKRVIVPIEYIGEIIHPATA